MNLASLPVILFFLLSNFLLIFFALQLLDKNTNPTVDGGTEVKEAQHH